MKKIALLFYMLSLTLLFLGIYFFGGLKEYNQGVKESERGNRELSQSIFQNLTGSYFFAQKALHNLGNLRYDIGLQEKEIEKQKQIWKESLEYYSGALALKKTQETQDNYNFVLSKLQTLETQKQEKKDEEEKKKTEKGDGKNSSSSGSENKEKESGTGNTDSSSGSSSEDNINGSNNGGDNPYKIGGKSQLPDLSEAERQYLESYQQRLSQEQLENQGNFNQNPSDIGDVFDGFLQSIGQGGEKDW